MRAFTPFWLALAFLVGSSTASAQTTVGRTPSFDPTVVSSVSVDDDEKESGDVLFINKADCDKDATIKFDVNKSVNNMSATVLELWRGNESQDCHSSEGRTRPSNGDPPCERLDVVRQNPDVNRERFSIKVSDVFGDGKEACSSDAINIQKLYVVPLKNTTPDSGTAPKPEGTAIVLWFYVDFDPPAAPTDVSGGSGETAVSVSWDEASGAQAQTDYRVYVDKTSAQENSDAACTSELLTADKELPSGLSENDVYRKTVSTTRATVNPSSLGISQNEMVAAGVVTVDPAGNPSVLSELVCVKYVPTSGFWEQCEGDAQCKDDFEECSVHLGRDRGFSASAALLGMVALWLARRRRNV